MRTRAQTKCEYYKKRKFQINSISIYLQAKTDKKKQFNVAMAYHTASCIANIETKYHSTSKLNVFVIALKGTNFLVHSKLAYIALTTVTK
jgi:hypothetical protein